MQVFLESDGDCLAARTNVHSDARITLGFTDEEKLALAAELDDLRRLPGSPIRPRG
jgi:hypothetical protein